jgi:TolB protein
MRLDRFDATAWAVLGLLSAALAVVILAGDRVGVRILRTLPEVGREVGAYTRVGIEFAQPMQANSAAASFSIEPDVLGAFIWEGRQMWFVPERPLQPGVAYTVRLAAGALSQGGQAVKHDLRWEFRVRSPWIVYVAPASAPHELWRAPTAGGEPQQLTETGGNVYDYSVSTDGSQIVYSVLNDERGIDLWIVPGEGGEARLLVDCGLERCSAPAWSPDGARVAYSRESAGIAPGAPHGPPRVWTAEAATGQTGQLYQDSQVLGYGPSWSPDGRRLAFFDGSVGGIRVLDLQTSAEMVLPSWMGVVGAWSPDGSRMLFNDLSVAEEQPYAKVFIADFNLQVVTPALGEGNTSADYSIPAWSPDGEWLVVGVRLAQQAPNEQLWLMRPDGSEARPITSGEKYTYGRYQWDPWGRNVLFQRLELGTPYPTPEIMIWPFDGGEARVLLTDATWAAWQP